MRDDEYSNLGDTSAGTENKRMNYTPVQTSGSGMGFKALISTVAFGIAIGYFAGVNVTKISIQKNTKCKTLMSTPEACYLEFEKNHGRYFLHNLAKTREAMKKQGYNIN